MSTDIKGTRTISSKTLVPILLDSTEFPSPVTSIISSYVAASQDLLEHIMQYLVVCERFGDFVRRELILGRGTRIEWKSMTLGTLDLGSPKIDLSFLFPLWFSPSRGTSGKLALMRNGIPEVAPIHKQILCPSPLLFSELDRFYLFPGPLGWYKISEWKGVGREWNEVHSPDDWSSPFTDGSSMRLDVEATLEDMIRLTMSQETMRVLGVEMGEGHFIHRKGFSLPSRKKIPEDFPSVPMEVED